MIAGETRSGGEHQVRWNGRGRDDRTAAAGVYVIRLEAGAAVDMGTLTLLK